MPKRPSATFRKTAMLAATLLLSAASEAGAGPASPCAGRYGAMTAFPPVSGDARPKDAEDILTLLDGKAWGVRERVTLTSPEGAPSPYVLEVAIPKGSINPGNEMAPRGGMGFRWRAGVPADARAACLAYQLWLPQDFDFNLGGKLPGIFGGTGPSGGELADGVGGFSVRLMWRKGGAGEVYAYVPGHPDKRGRSIDRGAFVFPRGRWIRIEEEVVLNTPGRADGELRLWIDGHLRIAHSDMIYRVVPSLGIDGVFVDVFYGGKEPEWAAPKDTIVRFSPFALGWR
ncbi:MAG: hypothetical protein R3D33_16190 [Hyphomicrobiaceae bacterium]